MDVSRFHVGSPQFAVRSAVRVSLSTRAAFSCIAYAFLVAMAGTTLPTPLYPIYQQRFGWGELLITVIFATYAVGVIVGLILTGRLSDEIGRRKVLVFGLGCAALSTLLFVVTRGVAPVLLARILSGLTAGAFAGTATAMLLDLAPEGRKALAAGVAVAVNLGGLGCGTLLSGALAQTGTLPIRLPYWVYLLLLVPALLAVVLAPETVEPSEHPRFVPQKLDVPPEVRGTFVRAALGGFSAFAIAGLFGAVGPLFLGKFLGYHSHLLAGAVLFILFLASVVGQFAVRRMSEHAALVWGAGAVVAAACLLIVALEVESLAILVVCGIVCGIGQGLAVGAGLAALGAETPAGRRGEVSATFFVVLYVGLALPIVAVGLLSQATGLRTAGVAIGGMAIALGTAGGVSLIARERSAVG
jgi:MFS family permease